MLDMRRLASALLAAGSVVGCGSSATDAPTGNTDGPAPTAVTVTTGNNFFRSSRNGSRNAAVDTVAVGGKVTWVWTATAGIPHNVQSIGTPTFASSGLETATGSRYEVTFGAPGSYRYNCAIHGNLMTGTIVVR